MTDHGLKDRKTTQRVDNPEGFLRDERGSFIIFGIAVFMLMCLAGGIAVDTMRYETHRVHVQGTLDRAILAAASLDQDLDPEEVVLDYFTKAGLGHVISQDDIDVFENQTNGEVADDVVLESVNGDATGLPFADGSFDRIIASEVMEHIDDDEAALAELARVLRPGGVLAVTIPARLPERICWALSSDYHAPAQVGGHVRIYGRHELRDKMAAAGLEGLGSHRAHALHSPYWWLRCAVGPNRPIEESRLVSLYHRLLTWDIVKAPRTTRIAERILTPVLGKSLVVYARKPGGILPAAPSPDRTEVAGVAA